MEETMFSDQKEIIMRVVEHFVRTGEATDPDVKVTCLPDNKTSFVEANVDGAEGGRSIMLDKFSSDGHVVWAGYSPRSGTVYLSSVGKV
jgi:hypothetical protein